MDEPSVGASTGASYGNTDSVEGGVVVDSVSASGMIVLVVLTADLAGEGGVEASSVADSTRQRKSLLHLT